MSEIEELLEGVVRAEEACDTMSAAAKAEAKEKIESAKREAETRYQQAREEMKIHLVRRSVEGDAEGDRLAEEIRARVEAQAKEIVAHIDIDEICRGLLEKVGAEDAGR